MNTHNFTKGRHTTANPSDVRHLPAPKKFYTQAHESFTLGASSSSSRARAAILQKCVRTAHWK
jgi:hypothetical protein